MKSISHIIIILFFLLILSVSAEAQNVYTRADSLLVEKMLNNAKTLPRDANLPLYFARQFQGKPYVAHTLEVADNEQLIVNTRQFDCTTLVETVTALTLCVRRQHYTFADYLEVLLMIRYRGGEIKGYSSRLHYFSDWIIDNSSMSLVRELQSPIPPFTATQHVHVSYMSQHPEAYKALRNHPELVPKISKQEQLLTGMIFRYIPISELNNRNTLRDVVHDGDIIAITCNKPGLDIAHLGFSVWRKDGLHLLNASSVHKKVLEEPMTLRQYMSKHPSFTGIRIIRINR